MRWISFLFLLWTPALSMAQKDFVSDTLYVVEGKSYYEGKKDLSATIKIFSTGDKIVVEATVVDDNVIINTDSVNCDHIEIQYSLIDEISEKLNTAGSLYHYYHDTTIKENSKWRFYLFDKNVEIGELDKNNFEKGCIMYGKAHYGVFPDNRKVYWYDKNCYSLLEAALGEKPGHWDQGIKYKAEKIKAGYKTSVSITPLGLGFISVPQMSKINMRIDVIDIDEGGTKTILSTFSSFHGSRRPYDSILFSRPLKTNVTSIPSYIYDSLRFSPVVMFSGKGTWSGVTRKSICKDDSCNVAEVYFYRVPFGYKKMKLNKTEIDKFSRTVLERLPDSNYKEMMEEKYFVNKKIYSSIRPINEKVSKFRDLKKEFVFTDGSPGLLLINYEESKECKGSSVQIDLICIKGEESKNIVLVDQNVCSDTTVIGKYVVPNWVIEKIYWLKEGSVLMIDGNVPAVGLKKFKVSLGSGAKVNVVEVKDKYFDK